MTEQELFWGTVSFIVLLIFLCWREEREARKVWEEVDKNNFGGPGAA